MHNCRSAFQCKTYVSIFVIRRQYLVPPGQKYLLHQPSPCYWVISTLVAERVGRPVLPFHSLADRPWSALLARPLLAAFLREGSRASSTGLPAGELRRPTARSSRPSAQSGAAPAAASTRSSRSRPSHARGAAPALLPEQHWAPKTGTQKENEKTRHVAKPWLGTSSPRTVGYHLSGERVRCIPSEWPGTAYRRGTHRTQYVQDPSLLGTLSRTEGVSL